MPMNEKQLAARLASRLRQLAEAIAELERHPRVDWAAWAQLEKAVPQLATSLADWLEHKEQS